MPTRVRRISWQRSSEGTCVFKDTRTRLLGLRHTVTTRRTVRAATDHRKREAFPTVRRTPWSHLRPPARPGRRSLSPGDRAAMHAGQRMPPMRRPGHGDNPPLAWTVAECPKHRGAACTWHHLERGPSTYGHVPGAATSIHGPRLRLDVPPCAASRLHVRYVAMFVGVLWRSTHKHHNKQVKIVTGNTCAVSTKGLLGDAKAQPPAAERVEVEGTIFDNVTLDNAQQCIDILKIDSCTNMGTESR